MITSTDREDDLTIEWHSEYIEYILDNLDRAWDFCELSENPNVTWEIVKANPQIPWNFSYLSRNANITWEIITENPNEDWDIDYLIENPNITWEIVRDNSDDDWDDCSLSKNKNVMTSGRNKLKRFSKTIDVIRAINIRLRKLQEAARMRQNTVAAVGLPQIARYFIIDYKVLKEKSSSAVIDTLDKDAIRGQGQNTRLEEWFRATEDVDELFIMELSETCKALVNAQFTVLALAQTLSSKEADPFPSPHPNANPLEEAASYSHYARALQKQLIATKALVNYAKKPTSANKQNLSEDYQTDDAVIALEMAFKSFEDLEKKLKSETCDTLNLTSRQNSLIATPDIDQKFSKDFENHLAALQKYLQGITKKTCIRAAKIVSSYSSEIDPAQQQQKLSILHTQWEATKIVLKSIKALMNQEPNQIAQPKKWIHMNEPEKKRKYGPFLPTLDIFLHSIPTNKRFCQLYPDELMSLRGATKSIQKVEEQFHPYSVMIYTRSKETKRRRQASSCKDQVADNMQESKQHAQHTTSSNRGKLPMPLGSKYGADL